MGFRFRNLPQLWYVLLVCLFMCVVAIFLLNKAAHWAERPASVQTYLDFNLVSPVWGSIVNPPCGQSMDWESGFHRIWFKHITTVEGGTPKPVEGFPESLPLSPVCPPRRAETGGTRVGPHSSGMDIYIYIYIYVQRERERERHTDRDRDRDREITILWYDTVGYTLLYNNILCYTILLCARLRGSAQVGPMSLKCQWLNLKFDVEAGSCYNNININNNNKYQ